MPATIKVFYSYASEDEPWRIQLEKHLRTLERQKLITGWHAHKIVAGTDKAQEIEARLNEADIILLLISPDFTDSDYCWGIELKRAIDRHNNDETHVIPILVRPADYKGAPFEKLEPLPTNAEPITTWLNRDQAFLDVAQGIRVVVETLIEKLADNPSKTISTNAT